MISFERGLPVALDSERLGLEALIDRAAEIGSRHGVGIVDHIEDRIVGLKVRDIYEVPAAEILLTAHSELEKLVSTIHQNEFKHVLDRKWAAIWKHQTQMSPDSPFLRFGPEAWREYWSKEALILRESRRVTVTTPETDVFAGFA